TSSTDGLPERRIELLQLPLAADEELRRGALDLLPERGGWGGRGQCVVGHERHPVSSSTPGTARGRRSRRPRYGLRSRGGDREPDAPWGSARWPPGWDW